MSPPQMKRLPRRRRDRHRSRPLAKTNDASNASARILEILGFMLKTTRDRPENRRIARLFERRRFRRLSGFVASRRNPCCVNRQNEQAASGTASTMGGRRMMLVLLKCRPTKRNVGRKIIFLKIIRSAVVQTAGRRRARAASDSSPLLGRVHHRRARWDGHGVPLVSRALQNYRRFRAPTILMR